MLLDDYNRTILGSLKRVSEWLVSGFYRSRHARAISQNEECSECSPISVSVNGSNHWWRVSKQIAVIVGTCPKKWASPRDMIRDRSRSGMPTVTGNRPNKRSASPAKKQTGTLTANSRSLQIHISSPPKLTDHPKVFETGWQVSDYSLIRDLSIL